MDLAGGVVGAVFAAHPDPRHPHTGHGDRDVRHRRPGSLLNDNEDEDELFGIRAVPSWSKVSCIIDTGAVEHVFPLRAIPQVPRKDTEASRVGRRLRSATGESIPNLGEKELTVKTARSNSKLTFLS